MVAKRDAQTVEPDFPVQRVVRGFEVREEGDAAGKGGEVGGGDGGEAVVF